MTRSELKQNAKAKLSGKWGKAIGINLIYLLLTALLTAAVGLINNSTISLILNIVIALVGIAISYGVTASLIKLSRNENVGLIDFLPTGLQNFGKIIKLYFSLILKLLLPMIAYIVGMLIMIASFVIDSSAALVVTIVGLILFIIGLIAYVKKVLLYAIPSYVLYDNPEATSKEVLDKTAVLMNGNRWNYVVLHLSFFGWYLLAGFVPGLLSAFIPTFGSILMYVAAAILTPYIAFTEINFYEDLAGVNNVSENPVQ